MSLYNGPPRPGARGGAAEFTWDSVKADKDRDYYLGHSVKASVGRWQKNKDIFWYTRDKRDNQQTVLADEIAAVKQREADLMAEALGLKPKMVRNTVTPRLDKQEMDALLRQGSGAAEDKGEPDPDRVHGLGFAAAPLGAPSEAVHETLQGVGMVGTGATAAVPGPLPAAGTAGASTSYPPPPDTNLMTAQQLQELAKQDKRAAKAAKKAQKAEKKAKKDHKKHKKQHKGDRHRSCSRSSSRSASPASRSHSRSRGREAREPGRRGASPSRHGGGGYVNRRSSQDRGYSHQPSRQGRREDSRERGRDAAGPLARGHDHHDGSRHHGQQRDDRGAQDEAQHGGKRRHDSPESHRYARDHHRHSRPAGGTGEQQQRQRSPVQSRQRDDRPGLEHGGGSRRRHDSP